MKKRLFAVVLSLVMVVSMLPMLSFSALADTKEKLLCEKISYNHDTHAESEHFYVDARFTNNGGWEMGYDTDCISCKDDYSAEIVRVEMVVTGNSSSYAETKVSSGTKRETKANEGSRIHIDEVYASDLYFYCVSEYPVTFFVKDIVIYYTSRMAKKPTSAGLQVYDGTEKTGVLLNDDFDKLYQLTDGCIRGTQPGSYSATFALKTDCEWEDHTTEPLVVRWDICETETLTYTPGESQTSGPVFTAEDYVFTDDGWTFGDGESLFVTTTEDFTEIVGADIRISKGAESYANLTSASGNIVPPQNVEDGAVFRINDIYAATILLLSEDASICIDQITVYYVKCRKVSRPEGGFVLYTGEEVSGIDTGSDLGTAYSLTDGTVSAVEPGTYFARFELNPGYIWEDNTRAPYSDHWSLIGTEVISEEEETLGQSEHFKMEGTYIPEKGWLVGEKFNELSLQYEDVLEMVKNGFVGQIVGIKATVTDDSAIEHIQPTNGDMFYENGVLTVLADLTSVLSFESDDEISDIYLKDITVYYLPMGKVVTFSGEKDFEENGARIHATSCTATGWKLGGGNGISVTNVSGATIDSIVFFTNESTKTDLEGWHSSRGELVNSMIGAPLLLDVRSSSTFVQTETDSDTAVVSTIVILDSLNFEENYAVSKPTVAGQFMELMPGDEVYLGLPYDGTEQFGVENLDGLGKAYTLVYGDLSATRVGKYSACFKLKPGYYWEDGDTDELFLDWEITKDEMISPAYLGNQDSKSFKVTSAGYAGDLAEMTDEIPAGWLLGPGIIEELIGLGDYSDLSVSVKSGLNRQIDSITFLVMPIFTMDDTKSVTGSAGTLVNFETNIPGGLYSFSFEDVNSPQFTVKTSFTCLVTAILIQYSTSDVCFVEKPTPKGGIGYTGVEVVGVETGDWLDTAYTLVGGQICATEPGNDYYAIFKLKDGYAWSDGDSERKVMVSWRLTTSETIEKGKNQNGESNQFVLRCADSPLLGWTYGMQGDARISAKSGRSLLIDSVELSLYDPFGISTMCDVLTFSSGEAEVLEQNADNVVIRIYDVEAPFLRLGMDLEKLMEMVMDERIEVEFPFVSINSAKISYVTADTVYVEKPTGAFAEYTGFDTTGIDTHGDLNTAYTLTDGTNIESACGVYSATFTLNDGYTWMDGTTEPVTVKWGVGVSETISCTFDSEEGYSSHKVFYSNHYGLQAEVVPPLTLIDYSWQITNQVNNMILVKEDNHYGILGIEADTIGNFVFSNDARISGTSGEVVEQFPLMGGETLHVFDVNDVLYSFFVDGPAEDGFYGMNGGVLINQVRIYHDQKKYLFPPVAVSSFQNLYYTGEEQVGVRVIFDSDKDYGVSYVLTDGVESATEVGKYYATYTIVDSDCCWPDGSTDSWTVEWEIKESLDVQDLKSERISQIKRVIGINPSERLAELAGEAMQAINAQTTTDGIWDAYYLYFPQIELLHAKDLAEEELTKAAAGAAPDLLENLFADIEAQTAVEGVEAIVNDYLPVIRKIGLKAQLQQMIDLIAPYDTEGTVITELSELIGTVDMMDDETVIAALDDVKAYIFDMFRYDFLDDLEDELEETTEGYTADRIASAIRKALQLATDAETLDAFLAAIDNGKEMITAAKDKTIAVINKAVTAAIGELEQLAGSEPSEEVQSLLDAAQTAMAKVKSLEAVNPVKEEAASAIAEQLLKEALAEAKVNAKEALETAAGENPSDAMQTILQDAKDAVDDADTLDAVGEAKEAGLSAIAAQLQTEADVRALEVAKEAAKAALDNAAGLDPSDATVRLLNIAKDAIEKATGMDAVSAAKEVGLSAISAQIEAEEQAAEALAIAKDAAKKALDDAAGESPSEAVLHVLQTAKGKVDKADSLDAVNTAKADGLAAIAEQIQADVDEKALEDAKDDAVKALTEAAGENPSDAVKKVLNDAVKDVIRAATIEEVDTAEEEGLSAISDALKVEADAKNLLDAKEAAVKALEEAAGENPSDAVARIVSDTKLAVEKATTPEAVGAAKEAGLSAVAEQLMAEGNEKALGIAKEAAKAAIDNATGENPSAKVMQIMISAKETIDACESVDAVTAAKEAGLAAIAAQLQKEANEKALADAKKAAKDALNQAAGDTPSDALSEILKEAIEAVDKSETVEAVGKAKEAGLAAIAEQLIAEGDEKALAASKEAAKAALDNAAGENPSEELSAIVAAAKGAVDACENVDAVTAAKEAGLAAIAKQLEKEKEPSADVLLGDANGDGAVDMKDVLLLRKFLAGLSDEMENANADVNEDGSIDMKDVLMIRKFLANLIEKLGA